eukprot:226855-Pyramimonas_sp.AAC.1
MSWGHFGPPCSILKMSEKCLENVFVLPWGLEDVWEMSGARRGNVWSMSKGCSWKRMDNV